MPSQVTLLRARLLWLEMPAENDMADNTTVIPGVVREQVLQQAIFRAAGKGQLRNAFTAQV